MFAVILGGFCKTFTWSTKQVCSYKFFFLGESRKKFRERKKAYTIFIYRRSTTDFNNIFFRLRSIDIEFMKRLGRIVSIVPVIAKADTLTIEERQEFKERASAV